MTFETFLSTLSADGVDADPYLPFNIDPLFRYARESKKTKEKVPALIQYWEVGGVSGGSCWDNSNPQPYSSGKSAPMTFPELDKALEAICPNITHLQYRRLIAAVKEEHGTDLQISTLSKILKAYRLKLKICP